MNKLYEQDISKKLIEMRTKVNTHENLSQNKIIRFQNLLSYQLHQLDDVEVREMIENLFLENIQYLDLTKAEFISSFPGNYIQRIFELVIAGFISQRFKLLNRDNDKTMEFSFLTGGKRYALECVTRTAGQMDKFYLLLPFFARYYQAAKIIFEGHTRWKNTYNIANSEWY
jgi:hypothetical protein